MSESRLIKIGIIGGSGLDDPQILESRKEIYRETPYGAPSDVLIEGKINGVDCVLLARHGRRHSIMPTNVNYRANIWALKNIGCTHVIMSTATGSLRENIKPGDLVILDNFIDRTTKRNQTFYDGKEKSPVGVCHLQMEPSFCPRTRDVIIKTAKDLNIPVHESGTVVTIEGPRFSSKAESLMFRQWGGDVINMTTVPEVILAKEAGLCYAAIAMATDYDCWRKSGESVCVADVLEMFKSNVGKVTQLLKASVANVVKEDWTKTINDLQDYEIIDQCTALLKSDYSVIEIGNRTGELSSHYPGVIIIPEYETNVGAAFPLSLAGLSGGGIISHQTQQQRPQQVIYENTHDPNKLRDLINKSRAARCRTRFPAPVILYKGKYVCRSSTLSGAPEMYGRYYLSSAESSEMLRDDSDCDNEPSEVKDLIDDNTLKEKAKLKPTVSDWQLFDRMRHQDIKLLKTLNVGIIVDFMVEKKKVKFGVNVTSSEKVDKEKRYSDFTILSLPYPGCEFFRDYRDNNYSGSGIVFDWSQAYVDADLGVPDDALKSQLNINWDNYKTWDLVTITKNYLKLILKYLQDKSSGLLLHCISGWDRTPLFVSLLRLSLWADGVIHQSLDANQILYLTISYDWYLFGHNLPDRLSKGEDIFFFCFYALKFIEKDEFSILSPRQKSKNSSGSSSISVLRTESECAMDDLIMMCGSDSRGSNISLNSISSCVSSKSHSDQNHVLLETSLDCTNRTSPVSVPIASRPTRQRNDSSSSLSVGSWQMISGTGSLRSVNDSLSLGNMFGNHNRSSHSNQMSQESSSCTLADDENASQSSTDGTTIREERLHAVRQLFYHSYCTSIGFRFNNGSDSRLGNLLGNFAEKVGLSQK